MGRILNLRVNLESTLYPEALGEIKYRVMSYDSVILHLNSYSRKFVQDPYSTRYKNGC